MSVPFFSVDRSLHRRRARLESLVDQAFDSGGFVNGPLVAALERELETYTGARQVVGVGSGTDALIIALKAIGVGPGDEVVVPVFTFFATASSVVHVGATPVFADIEAETYVVDPASADSAITARTKALMPVHPFRRMADMASLLDVAKRRGVEILEDSAQGIGMRQDGRHAGLHGRAGILSFFPAKTLGALGDAGAILTDDETLAACCRRLRNHGQMPGATPYTWEALGFNSRMDDLQAAVLLTRLPDAEAEIARRAELASRYDEALAPLAHWVHTPIGTPDDVVYVYLIEVERRDELVAHLAAIGIETETYYPRPLHQQPCFAYLGYGTGDFPVAERASQLAVALPLYPDLTDEQLERVCQGIRQFYAGERHRRRQRVVA